MSVHANVEFLLCVQEENTAFHLAAKHGHVEVLQKILETGENINERNIVSKSFL